MAHRTHAIAAIIFLAIAIACGPADQGSSENGLSEVSLASLSASDVMALAAENWGGTERLATLRTLRTQMTFHGHDYLVTVDVARPNLVRATGGDLYISVFDGEAAAFLKKTARDGTPSEPFLVAEEEVKDWELEKAWVFPAFFDHPAEYLGVQEVGEIEAHVLRVMLPLGARVDYFLDGESFLVIKAEAQVTIGDDTYESRRRFYDFQETDGILYPTRMDFSFGRAEPESGTIEGVEFDVGLPPNHFVIPDSIQ